MQGKLAYIGLGANLGDRLGNLQRAVALLAAADGVSAVRVSRVYASPPWGYASAHPFLNAVAELRWDGAPEELRETCACIETALGRAPRREAVEPREGHAATDEGATGEGGERYHDRVIDLDLLWFEGVACATPQLALPHPRAHRRAFVLLPWLELAPELVLSGRNLGAWLAELDQAELDATCVNPELVLSVPG